MTVTVNSMATIYKKLKGLGYKQDAVKELLPEWWDDSIASTPSGLQQTSLIMGKLFGIRPESLWTADKSIALSLPQERKFKHQTNVSSNSLDIACALAYASARLVLRAYKPVYRPELFISAIELRTRILQTQSYPNLSALLTYCEQVGIPVIYLTCLPTGAKKIAGFAFEIDDRPVIVVARTQKHGYLLFDVAHELGHISLGHVRGNKCVIDEKINENGQDNDADEADANAFALSVITGSSDCKIVNKGRYLTGQQLALSSLEYGTKNSIDPSHTVLNYGHSTKQWSVAQIALTIMGQNKISDQDYIRQSLFSLIETNELSEDDLAVLHRYCGA